ncbi:MAG: ABC transporter substrate-binding protein [Holosporaceae bacterium]|jgi:trehalose/maltose transport system substrate-binding protein|nr:ABC transporter substrate-binding protein [Holosporaceae bacterium]
MRRILFGLVLAIFCCAADGVTIKIACRSKGTELDLLKKAIAAWVKKTGNQHKVEVVVLPHASNECFALYRQWFSAKSFDVDILVVDIAWIGSFGEYLTDLREYINPEEMDEQDFFEAYWKGMHSGEQLVALPLYADVGIIFYRTDLLSKHGKPLPVTWEELYETAKFIQDEERKQAKKKSKFCGFVFQAKAFEILTCNFAEMVDSFGGAIVSDGCATIDSDVCVNATTFLIKCLRDISSNSVLNYSEEDARGMFQSGNAVFMRSWPYAYSLLNNPSTAVAGNVGVIPIPPCTDGGKESGVLGGWLFAVSKFSKHKKFAADLIHYLTSKEEQKKRSKHSYLPTRKSLYEDKDVLKWNPHFAYISNALKNAVARPSADFGKNYPRASTEIFNTINSILTDSREAEMSKDDVERRLKRLNKKLTVLLEKNKRDSRESFWQRAQRKIKKILQKIKVFLGVKDEADWENAEQINTN